MKPTQGANGGSNATAKRKRKMQRQRLRNRLAEEGIDPAEIDIRVEELRERQDLAAAMREDGCTTDLINTAVARLEAQQLRRRLGDEAAIAVMVPQAPNDSRYKPTQVDPLLKGAARATGDTARAVKRGRTLAKWEAARG